MGTQTNTDGISTLGTANTPTGLVDGTDSIHTGILNALNQQTAGSFVAHGLNVTQSSTSPYPISVSSGGWFDNGEYKTSAVTAVNDTLDSSGSKDHYVFLVIEKDTTALSLRTATGSVSGANTTSNILVASLTAGDIPVCLIKVIADTGAGARPTQFYGIKKLDSSFSAVDNSVVKLKINKDGTTTRYNSTNSYTTTLGLVVPTANRNIYLPNANGALITNANNQITTDMITNSAVTFAKTSGVQASLTHGIDDYENLVVNDTGGTSAGLNGQYARFSTSNSREGLEGRTVAELKTDLAIGLTDVSGDLDDIADGDNHKKIPNADATKISNLTVSGAIDLDAIKVKADRLTVSAATDLDSIKTKADRLTISANTDLDAIKVKADRLTVTGAIDVDAINTKVAGIAAGATVGASTSQISDIAANTVKVGITTTQASDLSTAKSRTDTLTDTYIESKAAAKIDALLGADSNAVDTLAQLEDYLLDSTVSGGLIQSLGSKVSTSTTVNGHALTGNVTITKANVGLGSVTDGATVGATTAQATAISNNTAKTGITSTQATAISNNTAKTGITSTQAGHITANNAKISYTDASVVSANTAKTGITTSQADAITANTVKTGITSTQAGHITANNAKTGITSTQTDAIAANTSKTGITSSQATAITANTSKTGITSTQAGHITANNAKVSYIFDSATDLGTGGDIDNDVIPIYDAGATAYKKVKMKDFLTKITANQLVSGGSGTGTVFSTLPASGATVGSILGTNMFDADGSTALTATIVKNANTNWSDVAGTTNAPANNATVGAVLGSNIFDTNGSTVLTTTQVKNENTTKADVGLSNVVNESPSTLKETMLLDNVDNKSASTLQSEILTAASASDVGLGSVTNESKTTMFTSPTMSSPTFTGTLGGVLSNVDNTADTAKPVSTAQATAIALKANIAGPTFTGTVGGITKAMVGLTDVEDITTAAMRAGVTHSDVGTTAANVGLGNVTNESKTTMFDGPTFTGDITIPNGASTQNLVTVLNANTTNIATNTGNIFSGVFTDLTSKPTTLAGYGITDALAGTTAVDDVSVANVLARVDDLTTVQATAFRTSIGAGSSVDNNDDVSVANLKTALAGPFAGNAVQIGDNTDDIITMKGVVATTLNSQTIGANPVFTDTNVSVANLKIALGDAFGSNAVAIGTNATTVTIAGDLVVSGTTKYSDETIQIVEDNKLAFRAGDGDAHEVILTAINPTDNDYTITLPAATFTLPSTFAPINADATPSWVPSSDPSYLTGVAWGDLTGTVPSTVLNSNVTPATLGLVIGTNVQAYNANYLTSETNDLSSAVTWPSVPSTISGVTNTKFVNLATAANGTTSFTLVDNPNTDTTYSAATTSAAGLLSTAHFDILNSVTTIGEKIVATTNLSNNTNGLLKLTNTNGTLSTSLDTNTYLTSVVLGASNITDATGLADDTLASTDSILIHDASATALKELTITQLTSYFNDTTVLSNLAPITQLTESDINAMTIDAATVTDFTVGVNVPANAAFSDTVYALTNDLAASEITAIQNIGATTISSQQWAYLGGASGSITNTDSNVSKANLSTVLESYTGADTLNIGDEDNDTTINIKGNLNVLGTTTTLNKTEIDVQDALVFTYDTGSDGYKTTLRITEPSDNRTVTIPDSSFTIPTQDTVPTAGNIAAVGAVMDSNFNGASDSSAGFLKRTGVGTYSIDTSTYLTGIASDSITYEKMQDLVTGNRLLGGTSAGTIGEVQVATNMVTDDAITYAKIQNIATANRILGSTSANGAVSEVQVATAMIANSAVSLGKMANLADGTIIGNISGSAAAPSALDKDDVHTLLSITDVGGNIMEMANPSAVRFLRINANNTISTLTDTQFRSAIGAGSGGGTVSSLSDLSITATASEINYLDNDDLTAADLTKLAALTATAAEINYLDDDDLTAADLTKLAAITASAAEINILTGGLADADIPQVLTLTELVSGSLDVALSGTNGVTLKNSDTGYLNIDVNGSGHAVIKSPTDAKEIIFQQYDGTEVARIKDNATFNIPASKLAIGGTAVTSTAAELNTLASVTAGTASASKAVVLDASKNISGINDLTVAGNLTVNGTTTTIDTTNLQIEDNIILLNKGQTGSAASNAVGIEVDRGSTVNAKFVFDDSDDKWKWTINGSTYYRLPSLGLSEALGVSEGGTGLTSLSTMLNSNVTLSSLGIGNVENKSASTIIGEIVASDIPNLAATKITSGTLSAARGGTGLTAITTLLNSNTTKSNVGLGNVPNIDFTSANTGTIHSTNYNGAQTIFTVQDSDETEVLIAHGRQLRFVEGNGLDINFTDIDSGADGDEFDLTFKVADGGIDSDQLATGGVDLGHLSATGTKSSSTYLRGDNTWATVSSGGGIDGSGTANQIPYWSDSDTLTDSKLKHTSTGVELESGGGVTLKVSATDGNEAFILFNNSGNTGMGFRHATSGNELGIYKIGEGNNVRAKFTTSGFTINNTSNAEVFDVDTSGVVTVNQAYTLPTTVTGANNRVLTAQTDGSTAWADAGGDTNAGGVDGSASAPTFSFASDSNNGLFLAASDQPAIAAGGLAVMQFGVLGGVHLMNNNRIRGGSGSAGNPTYGFIDDGRDNGMYKGGTDILGFSTAGTERMTISASGVVNIAGSLTVAGSAVGGATAIDGLSDAKSGGTNFTGSLLIGHQSHGTLDNAVYNTGVGLAALDALTTADNVTALGYGAGTSVTTGGNSVFVGTNAGNTITTNERITSIGTNAGKNSGFGEVSLGFWAGIWNLGLNNVNIGYAAGARGTTGANDNISIGNMAGGYSGDGTFEGHYNIFLGHNSGNRVNGASNYNIGIGRQTLFTLDDGSEQNIAIGFNAGYAVSTGDDNILIGSGAGENITTGSDNVIIGGIDASAVDVNDSLIIASGDGGTTWIEGNSDGIVLGALTPLFYERAALDTSAVDFRVPTVQSSTANPNGYPMPFAGKVVAASFLFAGSAISTSGNTNTIRIRKNGGTSGSDIKDFTFTEGDLNNTNGNQYSLVKSGSDVLFTFAAGDIIQVKRQSGSTDLNNSQAMLWVSYNF